MNRELVLAAQPERGATGDQQGQLRTGRQQRGQVGRGVDELFEVIQDQQHATSRQQGCEAVQRRTRGALACAKLLRDGGQDQRRIRDRRERDEGHAARKRALQRASDLDRQTRLTNAAGAGQGDEPHVAPAEQTTELAELQLAADERGGRDRHGRPERGTGGRRAGDARGGGARAVTSAPHVLGGLNKALRQQEREVVLEQRLELAQRREIFVRSVVVGANHVEQLLQAWFALRSRRLHVDQFWLAAGQAKLVFEAGELLVGCNPAVPLPVDPDEDVALGEVRAIQVARRMRTGPELEQS
jgi:hypothetical protein